LLENTTTNLKWLIAKVVKLGTTTSNLERTVAKVVKLGNTTIKRNKQQRLFAKSVDLETTTTNLDNKCAHLVVKVVSTTRITRTFRITIILTTAPPAA
jgi:hypothetical protein